MEPAWVNGISYYCRLLYKTNQNVLRLVDLDVYSDTEIFKAEDLMYEICEALNILIPYQIIKDKVCIPTDKRYYGILNFEADLKFLRSDIEELINNNAEGLFNIKTIRNKREHEAFNISANSFYSGNDTPIVAHFKYKENGYAIECETFINIIKEINIIFDKIISKFDSYAKENIERYYEHAYYNKYSNLNFLRFNNIYNSSILRDCGRAMIDF